jgi:hypothetical protein
MIRIVQGTVHGKRIELREDLGVPDGQEVDVVINVRSADSTSASGILKSAGAAADLADFDEVFQQIHQERRSGTFRDAK